MILFGGKDDIYFLFVYLSKYMRQLSSAYENEERIRTIDSGVFG